MRKYLLATTALLMFATPAVAKDHSGYVGLEGGFLWPKDPSGGKILVDYSATQVPATPLAPLPPDVTINGAFGNLNSKGGYDIDLIGGYDFGMFRVEGELGYKHSKIEGNLDQSTIDAINAALNRPVVNPLVLPGLVTADFDLSNKVHVWSGMLNGLLDFGGNGGIGGYVGAGVGYASVHAFDNSRSGIAWQLLAAVYYPVSDNIDIGLKGRYFMTGNLNNSDTFNFTGNPRTVTVGGIPCCADRQCRCIHQLLL